ncbi:unnamed protein product [Schistocephalus solidus]|uniref:Serpentine type 7TM GPCR chemoreceptor Srw n=1 Tax=Schistocephalus solidus TaxID=70667 RepID=A0A0X3PEE5_SCHSO|nr:unnamed protein product [Schistocephalus solidus]
MEHSSIATETAAETLEKNFFNCTRYPFLEDFDRHYKPIHAYLSLSICLFGTATNLLNAIVLTQRTMRSPTNMLLTIIALADSITMIGYLLKDVYLHFITSPMPEGADHGRAAIYFVLISNFVIIGGHIVATIVTVMLSAFRCWILYNPRRQITYREIAITSLCAILASFILTIPGFFSYTVVAVAAGGGNSSEQNWWFEVRNGTEYLESANFAIYGCIIKLAASFFIALFTGLILGTMRRARQRYLNLQRVSRQSIAPPGVAVENKDKEGPRLAGDGEQAAQDTADGTERLLIQKDAERRREGAKMRSNQRTTIMLVAVVVSFVITEAPQGVINTLVAKMGNCFLYTVYVPIGDLLDLLVLLNSSTNFILYCAMSQQFRASFRHLMENTCRCVLQRLRPTDEETELQPLGSTVFQNKWRVVMRKENGSPARPTEGNL